MIGPTPLGAATDRFFRERGSLPALTAEPPFLVADGDDFEPMFFGWEIARCVPGLAHDEQKAVAALVAACVASMRAGSTRMPLEGAPFEAALAAAGVADALGVARHLSLRLISPSGSGPVSVVIGRPGERTPLIVDGHWLYAERFHALEERLCRSVRARLAGPREVPNARAVGRAVAAVASGPPPLTQEQTQAVREALGASLALITGGPGTGKTATVVALLRALAWTGAPMDAVAIAAPTGKAAQRLDEAISLGLASAKHDLADAGLQATVPAPQTLHRLLGWSPSSGHFARHENDRLAYRVVIVDEASMIDLALMDRLLRSLRDDARLVLLGDADQLPSVDAGAVFRDLCAGLGAVRLTTNLRVARDGGAQAIVAAAAAVNAGAVDAPLEAAVVMRPSVDQVSFEGVEHLDARWSDVGDALLDRWWRERVSMEEALARRASRTFHLRGAAFDDDDRVELRALLDAQARSRILCATRATGFATSADSINARLLARLQGASGARPSRALLPGVPVMVLRNDYERGLFNGDSGLVARIDPGDAVGSRPMAVFPRRTDLLVVPLEVDLAPAFAMTVHKAQGSEFDHVALVLPETDLPMLTRELLYTAMTRARHSVLVVGQRELLVRAVARTTERHSGVAARLKS